MADQAARHKAIKLNVTLPEIEAALSVLARVEQYQESLCKGIGEAIDSCTDEVVGTCLQKLSAQEWDRCHKVFDATTTLENLKSNACFDPKAVEEGKL